MREGRRAVSTRDSATELFVVFSGSLRLVDVAVKLGPGTVLGEIGIFAPTHQRMDTAICETEVDLGVMAIDKVLELYHQNRRFGFYLIRLVSQRLLEDYASLRDRVVAARDGTVPGVGRGSESGSIADAGGSAVSDYESECE
jgi:CRP-like cAMP-binding protein